jgi:hypothetical protein
MHLARVMYDALPFFQKAALHLMRGSLTHAPPFIPSTNVLLIAPLPDKSLAEGEKRKISS